MFSIMSDTRRWGAQHLSVIPLVVVVVVGLTQIERVGAGEEYALENPQSICELPAMVEGGCLAYYPSWSYVRSSGKCEWWVYGGCGGNSNRFRSQLQCEQTCLRSAPSQMAYGGPSKARFDCNAPHRYDRCNPKFLPSHVYFDARRGQCLEAPRGLCVFGPNNFKAIATCQRSCLSNKQVCDLPAKVRGECAPGKANIPVWSYVKSTRKCEPFYWGGCRGNANNFWSKPECEQTCLVKSRSWASELELEDGEEEEEEQYV